MVEENKDIFFAGGDALLYLAIPVHKKYSATFVWDHPFKHMYAFRVTVSAVGLFQKILLNTMTHMY